MILSDHVFERAKKYILETLYRVLKLIHLELCVNKVIIMLNVPINYSYMESDL